jgi:hypothetical protein
MTAGEPLASICRSDPKFPSVSAWGDWCNEDKSLGIAHQRARADGFDAIAAETLKIAETPMMGSTEVTLHDGRVEIRKGDMLGHRKLQIETRLKLLAKWDPRRYGELLKLGNADGSNLDLTDRISKARERKASAMENRND